MAASRIVSRAVSVGQLSASVSQPLHRKFRKEILVTTAAPQYLKQTQSSLRRTQVYREKSTPAGRHTRAAAEPRPDLYGLSDSERDVVDSTQMAEEAARQACPISLLLFLFGLLSRHWL